MMQKTNNFIDNFKVFCILLGVFCLYSFHAQSDDFDDDFSVFEEEMSKSKTKIYDPLEPINRKIFVFNDYADQYLVGYLVKSYRYIFPKPIRNGIGNFFNNLSKPFSVVNSFAQGKSDNGLASLSSFVINTTIGIFGFIDVAGDENIVHNDESFGQTLGYYGVGTGPYLVLPFLGPSTLREFSSDITENSLSPIGFDVLSVSDKVNVKIDDETKLSLAFIKALDKRESLSELLEETKSGSFDYYATIRSYYLQNLENNVNQ